MMLKDLRTRIKKITAEYNITLDKIQTEVIREDETLPIPTEIFYSVTEPGKPLLLKVAKNNPPPSDTNKDNNKKQKIKTIVKVKKFQFNYIYVHEK